MRTTSVGCVVLFFVVLVSAMACSRDATNPRRDSTSKGGEASVIETHREQLVVLAPEQADEALAEIEAVASVTQLLRPRLLLVLTDPEVREGIRRIPGVLEIYDTAPEGGPLGLSPEEQLFVDAWAARSAPKTRPGEGSNWDAPGFEPPDIPGR
ncbi:hypothetical protein [Rhodococcus sp. B50]|uniref:hypothetical protein n=1 Tax=Rhodococcus sp. B50 TaxID=2682847 RepID=UPI001BD640E7|nr:hypothetical protein [Rhodococcus sp. B50]MBS9372110.1 hypothetical protein [Rhodococcus sp. B50]